MPSIDRVSLSRIFFTFLKLGCTSFGGPTAHLAFYRESLVNKLRWMTEEEYASIVALCQFLPGPGSSQVGFSIGIRQGGLRGGFAAWLGFTLPSAFIMIAFAYGISSLAPHSSTGWVNGLKAVVVAVVAKAVWQMAPRLCPDWPRKALAAIVTLILLFFSLAWVQVLCILLGAAVGAILLSAPPSLGTSETNLQGDKARGAVSLVLFFILILLLHPLARLLDFHHLNLLDAFYRAGSLVFGGGHVVLPLLQSETVVPGWLTQDEFMAGYGIAQAVPGPLFSFSAYLGTVMTSDWPAWLNGIWCLIAIYLPAWLLVAGILPFWNQLMKRRKARAALNGTNASVVGLLLAALIHPVGTSGIQDTKSLLLALCAFLSLQFLKLPPWSIVLLGAGVGFLLW